MPHYNMVIKYTYDDKLHKSIEGILGTKAFFERVYYFYSVGKNSGYTSLFFRAGGGDGDSPNYCSILTKKFKTVGFHTTVDDTNLKIYFYDNGKEFYSLHISYSAQNIAGSYSVSKADGDVSKLKEIINDGLDLDLFKKMLDGRSGEFFFPNVTLLKILNSLNINDLRCAAFWDWGRIIYYYGDDKHDDVGELIELGFFENLSRAAINPGY